MVGTPYQECSDAFCGGGGRGADLQEELAGLARGRKDVWTTLLSLLPPQPGLRKEWETDGWVAVCDALRIYCLESPSILDGSVDKKTVMHPQISSQLSLSKTTAVYQTGF